ncbi:MAG: hypothetical protein KAT43_03825 [Nanoarchaeota archaeon]|nr:hypothetical protein [Nanoarchaeota archaeon]
MKQRFYQTIDNITEGAKLFFKVGATIALAVYIPFMLASHDGVLDSDRIKEAARKHDPSNPVKTVRYVEEEWKDIFLIYL